MGVGGTLVNKKQDDMMMQLMTRLLDQLETQNKHQTALVEKLLEQNAEASKTQRAWLELFKPPSQGAIPSTTISEREAMIDNDEWTTLDEQQMLKDLFPTSGDSE